jgi:hypothetical protein
MLKENGRARERKGVNRADAQGKQVSKGTKRS